MKTLILAFVALTAVASAAPKRYALLVGVNEYSFETKAQRLQGAGNDVGYMGLLTSYCGFKSKSLTEANAKKAAIVKELKVLEDEAASGDQVLFYFSGRGSIDAKKAGGTGLQPTLVPADGVAATSANDLAMSDLEAWATRVSAKGATPIVVLDSAYYVSGDPAKRENRFYQYKPKAVVRAGKPRADVWKGPGVCLSATDMTGNAFEWRVDPVLDKWRSAFTDLLVGRALSRLKKGEAPTYTDIDSFLTSYWRKDPTYMPKTRPYPAPAAAGKGYADPMFAMAGGSSPAVVEPKIEQQVQAEVQNFEKKRRILRVAVDAEINVLGEAERSAIVKKYNPLIAQWVKENLDGVEVVPTAGDQKDRSLYVSEKNGNVSIRVIGDEITERDAVTGTGTDVGAAFNATLAKGSLALYVQKQAYTERLWNLVEMNNPTLTSTVTLTITPQQAAPGDRMKYQVTGDAGGYLYLFDQDDSDGIVELAYPASNKREPTFEGDRTFPIQVADGTPTGKTLVRALVAVPAEGVTLPSITVSPDQLPQALLAHLKALVEGIANGSIKWRNADAKYEVGPH